MNFTLGDFLDSVCDRYGSNTCIYYPTTETTYTYNEFLEYVNTIAGSLIALSLQKGDLIALKLANRPEWLALQWAASKLGIITVGLNAKLTTKEVDDAMIHTGAKLLFTDDNTYMVETEKPYRVIIWTEANGFLINLGKNIPSALIEQRQMEVTVDDAALILFTSGTTSSPKAVVLSHKAIIGATENFNGCLKYTEEDHALVCTPFAHIMGGLYSVLPVLGVGAKMTILEQFSTTRALEMIQREKCTIFNGVPAMFMYLLEKYKAYDISSLKKGLITGSYVSQELFKRIYYEMGMTHLIQAFGQTETLAVTGTNPDEDIEIRAACTGKALDHIELKIIDSETSMELPRGKQGELIVKTPYGMIGYLKNPKANKRTIDEEGWIHTGDVAYIDEKGYLYIKSRIKDIIIKSGENICPGEVEEAMLSLEEVQDVSVIGVPDVFKTEEICAFIIPQDEKQLNIESMKQRLLPVLAKYKIPKYIIRIKDFPRTSSGKVRKNELKFIYSVIEPSVEGRA